MLVNQSLQTPVAPLKAFNLGVAGDFSASLFEFADQSLYDGIHAPFHIVVTVMHKFGV